MPHLKKYLLVFSLTSFYRGEHGKDPKTKICIWIDWDELEMLNALHHDENRWLDNADGYNKQNMNFLVLKTFGKITKMLVL